MAKKFTINGIATGQTIEASQVSQSVQAMTSAEAYDIQVSGSLILTGSFIQQSGSAENVSNIQLKQVAMNTGSALPASYGFVAIGSTGLLYSASAAAGSQGAVGAQGTNGVQGTVGTVGSQGNTGTTGTQGVNGTPGSAGSQGGSGAQGTAGSAGAQGESGPAGPQGTEGLNGSQGADGSVGSTGSQGTDGTTGPAGGQGTTGNTGAQGNAGSTGPNGPSGPQGTIGNTGSTGPTGPTGTQGALGTQGTIGTTGPTGPVGTQGALGTQGTDGTTGTQGETGAGTQGAAGIQGITGTGTQGAIGTGAQGTIGTTGTQGETGTGAQGASGTIGTQGETGAGTTGPQGANGTVGTQGGDGTQGAEGSGGGSDTAINPQVRYISNPESSGREAIITSTGTVFGNKTWSRTGTETTVTSAAHGLTSNDFVVIRGGSDTYHYVQITVSNATTFTFQSLVSGTASGTDLAYIPAAKLTSFDQGSATLGVASAGNVQVSSITLTTGIKSTTLFSLTVNGSISGGAGVNSSTTDQNPPIVAVFRLSDGSFNASGAASLNTASPFNRFVVSGVNSFINNQIRFQF